jgi:hypothetical protein
MRTPALGLLLAALVFSCGRVKDDRTTESAGAAAGSGGSTTLGAGGQAPSGIAGQPAVSSAGTENNSSGGSGDEAASPLAGHTYLLALNKNDWAVPRGVGTDLFGSAPAFLFHVEGTGTDLTTTIGYGPGTALDASSEPVTVNPDDATQDACGPTVSASFSGADPQHSLISVPNMKIHVLNTDGSEQVTADAYNVNFTDVLPNDSSPSTNGSFEVTMDFKQLYVLFDALGPTRSVTSVCAGLSQEYTPSSCTTDDCKVQCEPCPAESGSTDATCLTVRAEGIGAVQADNIEVQTITVVDQSVCRDGTPPHTTR